MDEQTRAERVQALEAIKEKAMSMADRGADATEVRDFINDGKAALAYELPDLEAASKAFQAVNRYKAMQAPKTSEPGW